MKNWKRITIIGAAVLVIGATSVTAAAVWAGYSTPAEIVTDLTGQSTDSLIAQRSETGKTYGTIAEEAGVLDEFEQQMLDQKKALLEERVAAGTMTRERADAILAAMEDCDGTGSCRIGSGMGAGFGGMGTGSGGTGERSGGMGGNRLGGGRSGSGCGLEGCTVTE